MEKPEPYATRPRPRRIAYLPEFTGLIAGYDRAIGQIYLSLTARW
jgi:hypothetical protein